jgi:hypothetical protein
MFTGVNVTEKACALYWVLYPHFNLLNIVKRSSPEFLTKKKISMIMGNKERGSQRNHKLDSEQHQGNKIVLI